MEKIKQTITNERLKPGDALPTEEELQKSFGVSRATVRCALGELERQHIIERRQGVGTFVTRPPLARDLRALTSFTEEMIARGLAPSTTLIAYETPDESDVPEELSGIPVVRVVRLRLADSQPISIHDAFIPTAIANQCGFTRAQLKQDGSLSLYAQLEAAGYFVDSAREHVTAVAATARQARLLGVKTGAPLIKTVRVSWTRNEQILEHITAYSHPEHFEYTITLARRAFKQDLG